MDAKDERIYALELKLQEAEDEIKFLREQLTIQGAAAAGGPPPSPKTNQFPEGPKDYFGGDYDHNFGVPV